MEQVTMDKKSQSRLHLLCKNNQEPSKSSFDYVPKKNGSQYPRKRENEKFDNGKKSSAIRGGRAGQRYVRPREKMGGQVDEKDPEFGSLQKSGGKKQNITHLLNWWGPGPERYSGRNVRENSNAHGYKTRKNTYARYNKEHYLQANCQFIVSAGHDYSSYTMDPDRLVEWDFVEEVRLHMCESPACPICLHPPTAAKVTRCGHIFCYPCILHYLALTDDKWRKCPICFDAVMKADLKSVVTILHKNCTADKEIELKLMRRDRDSLIPMPVTCFSSSITKGLTTLSSCDTLLSYAKLIVASKSEVLKCIVAREKEELMTQMALEGDQPEACFIQEALSLVSHRETYLSGDEHAISIPQGFTPLGETKEEDCKPGLDLADQEERMVQEVEESENAVNIQPEDLDIAHLQENASLPNQDAKGAPKPTYYFYQESSGAHVYLHALNIHMLVKEFGSLDKCPPIIKAKVLEKESGSMTDALRQRLRYLRHLPVTCPYDVVEVEMKPPLVSPLTVEEFQGQLDVRARRRWKRARAEHRIEKRVRVEEDRMMGRSRGARINMTSFRHFPSFAEDRPPPPPPPLASEEEVVPSPLGASSCSSVADESPPSAGPSFAQMIRCGQKKSPAQEAFPAFPSLGSALHHLSPVRRGASAAVAPAGGCSDEEEEGDRVPDFNASFCDAFAKALDQATKKVSDMSTNEDAPQSGRKAKKKKKGILLLSSGGR